MTDIMRHEPAGRRVPSSGSPKNAGGLLTYLPAVAMLIASVVVLGGLSLRPPADERQVAAIFEPGAGFASIQTRLAGTGMRLVRNGLFENIVIVDLGDRSTGKLLEAGAWFVVDPQALGGCFAPPTTSRSAEFAGRVEA